LNQLYLIDSSAWIFALGAKPMESIRERVEELVENNLAAITSPIFFELVSAEKSNAHSALLAAHLSALHPFPLLPQEWGEAADWTREHRQKGHKIKTVDALIAYKAHKHHLTLVHADADMDRIAAHTKLEVESYVKYVRSIDRIN
jgi:predicted nucleic acid-binding protein